MAFEVKVSRDGEWVTQDVNIGSHPGFKTQPLPEPEADEPLKLGIMSRTVIPSPIIRKIIPARIRSIDHNDIVYVGDYFIQVVEMREDGQLYEVARKSDFDYRIRHSAVLGNHYEQSETWKPRDIIYKSGYASPKCSAILDEDAPDPGNLPPQIIVLILESNDVVFLFVGSRGDTLEFKWIRQDMPPSDMCSTQTMHFAVDPESRYMAMAFVKQGFCIFELEPPQILNERYRSGDDLKPVKSWRVKQTNDFVLKLDFLYPDCSTNDQKQMDMVILMLALVRGGETRVTSYDWTVGDDLQAVFSKGRKAHRVHSDYHMPLMIVPLTVRSSFCLITETKMAVCDGLVHGSPTFQDIERSDKPATQWYHGNRKPLWCAWTRPYRRKDYYVRLDNIYVAREDGVVIFLEIRPEDTMASAVEIGETDLQTSIDTAFTTISRGLDDFLIIGGDCGNGSVWTIPPRRQAELRAVIPNWVPALDMVSSDEFLTWNQKISHNGVEMVPWSTQIMSPDSLTTPNRLYTTSCRGTNGAITEHRVGIPASVIGEFACPAVRQTWVFPQSIVTGMDVSESEAEEVSPEPFYVLLSSRDTSDVLLVSYDLETRKRQWTTVTPEKTLFDIDSHTLDAHCRDGDTAYQITEKSLVMMAAGSSQTVSLSDIIDLPEFTVENASIANDLVALTVLSDLQFMLCVLEITELSCAPRGHVVVDGEITCLHVDHIGNVNYIFAGLQRDNHMTLIVLYNAEEFSSTSKATAEFLIAPEQIPDEIFSDPSYIEAFYSLKKVYESEQSVVLVGGTRAGFIVTLTLNTQTLDCVCLSVKRLGMLPVSLSTLPSPTNQKSKSLLAASDTSVVIMDDYVERINGKGDFRTITKVLATGTSNLDFSLPTVYGITLVPHGMPSRCSQNPGVLMVTSGKILFTELEALPRPVPRQINTGGTPKLFIYSNNLDCIVAYVLTEGRPYVKFIDPRTGRDMTYPTTIDGKNKGLFIQGLGDEGDRVLCLKEWTFTKDEQKWIYILVGTQSGRIIVVSTLKEADPEVEGARRVRCWMRNRSQSRDGPIYSVHPIGEDVFYCTGTYLNWSRVSTNEKKLITKFRSILDSPAISIESFRDKISVMTISHSLFIISPETSPDGQSHWLKLENVDPKSFLGRGMIDVGPDNQHPTHLPITLFADREQTVAGRWIPPKSGAEIKPIFEATLRGSIRKLCRGRTQPPWSQKWAQPRFGRVPSTVDDAEIFGVCMSGSIEHLTLLDMHAWSFLMLVQKMAQHTESICPFSYLHFDNISHMTLSDLRPLPVTAALMHVDGNILQRCMDKKALELCFDLTASKLLMQELLGEIDGGYWVMDIVKEKDAAKRERLYFELAYDILEYYLRPVL